MTRLALLMGVLSLTCCTAIRQPAHPLCVPLSADEHVGAWGQQERGSFEPGSHRELTGIVVAFDGKPVADTLVEVFPGCRIEEPWATVRNDTSWPRRAGCRVGTDGRFSFPALPPGDYEIRAGNNTDLQAAWNVTRHCVRLARGGSGKRIRVLMFLSD
jgi:hypothetical protein